MSDDNTMYIEGAADPTNGRPVCLIRWGAVQAEIPVEQVFATARDLAAAAVAAETDKALMEELMDPKRLALDLQTAGQLLVKVRERRDSIPRQQGAARAALRIGAVYGVRTKLPLVHIARGSMNGELSPDEARQMAQDWNEAAVASVLDARFRYAMGDVGMDHVAIEDVFKRVAALLR
ncbi:hypothetical protein [Streptomyces sp. NPDC087300]|uniref:hypothetical protein n=1 Tax=Streptomyces sp. NPDC087300 TaxID=3365780 RepID=UPI0037F9B46F